MSEYVIGTKLCYTVQKIEPKVAKAYICAHHYSHGCHNGPSPCYGLFDSGALIGVLMFATPCSENVRASLFGTEHKDRVVELHRLHILDVTPRNAETYFISRCLRLLVKDRPQTRGVISFADSTQGHRGTIYRASNFWRCGTTGAAWFYTDQSGRLRHPRQNGVNITKDDALSRGWKPVRRGAKNRYVYIVAPSRKEKRFYESMFLSRFPKASKTVRNQEVCNV